MNGKVEDVIAFLKMRAEAAEAQRDAALAQLVELREAAPEAVARIEKLRLFYETASCGRGCHCDPPGSGEEWCTGTCYARSAQVDAEKENVEFALEIAHLKARLAAADALAKAARFEVEEDPYQVTLRDALAEYEQAKGARDG